MKLRNIVNLLAICSMNISISITQNTSQVKVIPDIIYGYEMEL